MMSKPLEDATDFPNVMLNVTSLNNQQSSDIAGGVAFSILVVCALALTLVDPLVPDVMDTIEDLGYSIVDAAVPLTATDVVSVTVGEAVGGIVGAVTSYSIAQLIRASQVLDKAPKVSDAVANGDFLVTQAAARPLLNAIGLPPFLATVGSALLASVPAEIVKNTARRQRQQQEEEVVLEQLLQEDKEQKKFELLNPKNWFQRPAESVDVNSLQEVAKPKESLGVEIAIDVIKWLGYGVLINAVEDQHLSWNQQPLLPGLESAVLGTAAGLCAQLYGDIMYGCFVLGGKEKQDEIRSRSLVTWTATYFAQAITAASLFGVYELVQIPAAAFVSMFLSGGAEG